MIDKQYIELMNKEIDGLLSVPESEELKNYLNQNKEAEKYFAELKVSVELLSRLPDEEPGRNLKQFILNSIDKNKYSFNKPAKIKIFSPFQKFLKPRFTFALAAGILIGIVLYPLLFTVQNNKMKNNLSGTMGVNENITELNNVTFNNSLASCKIILYKTNKEYWFKTNLIVKDNYTLKINFNPLDFVLDNVSASGNGELKINKKENAVTISGEDNSIFRLYFNRINLIPANFRISLIVKGQEQLSRLINIE